MAWIIRELGDVLINANDSFPSLPELERTFDMLFFLDFCTGLDAAVVHHQLHTVGAFPGSTNSVALALRQEGVIRHWSAMAADPMAVADATLGHPRAKMLLDAIQQWVPPDGRDVDVYARVIATSVTSIMDVVLEVEQDLPLVPSAHFLPVYLRLRDVAQGERILRAARRALAAPYVTADAELCSQRERLDGRDFIPLPPIALEVLDKADSLEQVGEVLLETRKRYAPVREYFRELEGTLISTSASFKEKQVAETKLKNAIRQALTASNTKNVSALGALAKGVLEAIEFEYKIGEHTENIVAFPLARMAEKLTDLAQSGYWRYRLRPLYSTIRQYMDASPARIKRVIHKHFHHTVGDADVALCRSYASQVAVLLRSMSSRI